MSESTATVESLLAHRGWVRALAWSLLRDADAVDEVEQETWLRALRSPPSDDGAARGWLATVVRNVVRNRFRSSSRRRTHETAAARSGTSPATVDVVARADAQQGVVQAVMRLREPYRTTLLLRHYDGLPPREIAARLDVSVETVRSRVRRALIELRADLERERSDRGGMLALLTPLLGDGVPVGPTVGAGSGAGAASVTTTLTGGLAMAVTTKKLIAGAAVVLMALTTWLVVDPLGTVSDVESPSVATADDVATAETTGERSIERVPRVTAGDTASATDDATPEDAPPGVTTELDVVRADGSPVAGVRAVAWREFVDPTTYWGTDDGRVHIEGDGLDQVAVTAPGRPVHVVEIQPGVAGQRIVLPDGLSVTGVVRVNHAVPSESVLLRLHPGGPDPTEGLPKPVRNQLSTLGWGYGHATVETGPGGEFTFTGLPASEGGAITVPSRRYEFADTGSLAQDVAVPARDLVLDLLARPHFHGRVVFEDESVVREPRLRYEWTVDGRPENSGAGTLVGTAEGAFELFLPTTRASSARLRISDAGGVSWTRLELPLHDDPSVELGEIVLGVVRQVQAKIVDAAGQPISEARVVSGQSTVRSGDDGVVELPVAGERSTVRVAALGHRVATVELVRGAPEPVLVRLVPAPMLTVDVVAEGAKHGELRVRLTTRGELPFLDAGAAPSALDLLVGASRHSVSADWREPDGTLVSRAWFEPDARGRVVLNGLRPDQPLRLELYDEFGTRLDATTLRLGPTESRRVTLQAKAATYTIGGVVRGFDGKPLPDAFVYATDASETVTDGFPNDSRGRTTTTDEQGRFELTGLRTRAVHLAVTSETLFDDRTHAPWIGTDVDTASAGALDVRLKLGHTLRLRLRLPDESWLTDAWLDPRIDVPVREPDWFWPTDETEDGPAGTYVLRGLPMDLTRIEFAARVWHRHGSDNYELTVDTSIPEQTLDVGAPASSDRAESE